MVESGRPLSELKTVMRKFPQTLLNVRVSKRRDLDTLPAVQRAVSCASARLGSRGRVLVRYSGTEPLVRILVEGEDLPQVVTLGKEIAEVLRGCLS
jgi:phosphoglucosamine mutase